MAGKWKEVIRLHFEGERFRDHALDLSAIGELRHFQKMVENTAEELWRAAHPDRERIPKNFKDRTRLCLRQIEDGSAATPLEIYIEEEDQAGLWVEEPGELKEAVNLAMDVFDAANADKPIPDNFPKALLGEYANWGQSLAEDEFLEMIKAERSPVQVSHIARERLAAMADAPYEDAVDVVGQVLEADVKNRRFQLWLNERQQVKLSFSPEQEQEVTTALKEYQALRLHVLGRGRFSPDGVLREVTELKGLSLQKVGEETYDPSAPSIEDVLMAISKQIPDEEWKKLPEDLSSNLDHYIYGVAEE
jgi:hypothetical protein